MSIFGKIKAAWTARKAAKKFQEDSLKNGWPTAAKRAALIAAPPVVAYMTAACPALFSWSGLVALFGASAAAALSYRKGTTATTATATAGASFSAIALAAYAGAKDWIDGACGTTFLQQLPTLLTTALSLGLAAYMRGSKEEKE